MKIAVDGRCLGDRVPRGWNRYFDALLPELIAAGARLTLFTTAAREARKLSFPAAVRVLSSKDDLKWQQLAVPYELLRGKYDLWFAPTERGIPLVSPCPTVLTLHSATTFSFRKLIATGALRGSLSDYLDYDTREYRFAALYQKAQVRRATHYLTPSNFSRDEILESLQVAPNRVTVTPLAVAERFTVAPDAAKAQALRSRWGIRAPYLLYVGGFERHKNVSRLLDVFAVLRARNPTLMLVLVGSAEPPADFRRKLEAFSEGSVVPLVGLDEDLPHLYDGAAAYVSFSWRESFGLTALEAMSRGVVPVLSAWGAAREVVGDQGVLVEPQLPLTDLADAIERGISLGAEAIARERLRARAAQFSWRECAEKTLGAFARVISRR